MKRSEAAPSKQKYPIQPEGRRFWVLGSEVQREGVDGWEARKLGRLRQRLKVKGRIYFSSEKYMKRSKAAL